MSTVQLNLARKWRSKDFDQIIGQDLCVRMLKNSLYLNNFFPVYLFAGNRGCGKTSTARIFAAAINCEQLSTFQQNPKSTQVPCLACASCVAMAAGKHPDFFEIDAASHTGVDTIRQIIDSSTLLPLMGRKKIYLIDEAHMLSKASFNALLKILEEPPHSVLFMLATTDSHKIIDTVKSRCFQLLFKPITQDVLVDHLATICAAESIVYDRDGLQLIVKESEGSARDAINVLEQVRFGSSAITKQTVLQTFGYVSDEQLISMFSSVLTRSPKALVTLLHEMDLESYSAEFIWHRLLALARAAIWLKHGVEVPEFALQTKQLKELVTRVSWLQLNDMLDQLYAHEPMFAKTTAKHALLEMILLQLSYKFGNSDESGGASSAPQKAATDTVDPVFEDDECEDEDEEEDEEEDEDTIIEEDEFVPSWDAFIQAVDAARDPLLSSIFKQGSFVRFDAQSAELSVAFSQEFSFFNDWLTDTKSVWQPLLDAHFKASVQFKPVFKAGAGVQPARQESAAQPKPVQEKVAAQTPVARTQQPEYRKQPYARPTAKPKELVLDVSDVNKWPLASLLVKHFPGAVTEVKES